MQFGIVDILRILDLDIRNYVKKTVYGENDSLGFKYKGITVDFISSLSVCILLYK